jgi:hypothetical protein
MIADFEFRRIRAGPEAGRGFDKRIPDCVIVLALVDPNTQATVHTDTVAFQWAGYMAQVFP